MQSSSPVLPNEPSNMFQPCRFDHGLQRELISAFAFACDFSRSMQHLDSSYREEDVADEAKIENILYRTTKSADVGSLQQTQLAAQSGKWINCARELRP